MRTSMRLSLHMFVILIVPLQSIQMAFSVSIRDKSVHQYLLHILLNLFFRCIFLDSKMILYQIPALFCKHHMRFNNWFTMYTLCCLLRNDTLWLSAVRIWFHDSALLDCYVRFNESFSCVFLSSFAFVSWTFIHLPSDWFASLPVSDAFSGLSKLLPSLQLVSPFVSSSVLVSSDFSSLDSFLEFCFSFLNSEACLSLCTSEFCSSVLHSLWTAVCIRIESLPSVRAGEICFTEVFLWSSSMTSSCSMLMAFASIASVCFLDRRGLGFYLMSQIAALTWNLKSFTSSMLRDFFFQLIVIIVQLHNVQVGLLHERISKLAADSFVDDEPIFKQLWILTDCHVYS